MYVINDKVFLHLQKTSGTSFKNNIKKTQLRDFRFGNMHGSIYKMPEQYLGFKRYAFVRNPLTWYTSYYYYNKKRLEQKKNVNSLMKVIFCDGDVIVSLDEFIFRATDLDSFLTQDKCDDIVDNLCLDMGVARNQWLRGFIDDIYDVKPHFIKASLYQYYTYSIGIETAQLFKMDDKLQREELHRIFNLKDNVVRNVTNKPTQPSEASLLRILEKDEVLFDLFDYPKVLKELNDRN